MTMITEMDTAQRAIGQWTRETFGTHIAIDPWERSMRLIEEAIELVQATGIREDEIHAMVDRVYSDNPGNPAQEAAQVLVTLFALASAHNIALDHEFSEEFFRISASKEEIRESHREKAAQGLAKQGGIPA